MTNFTYRNGTIEGDVEVSLELCDILEDVPVEKIIEAVGEREVRDAVLMDLSVSELQEALGTDSIREMYSGDEAIELLLSNNAVEDIVGQMELETKLLFAAQCGAEEPEPVAITSSPVCDGVTKFLVGDRVRGLMICTGRRVTVRYFVDESWAQSFDAETEAQAVNIFNAIMNWNRKTVAPEQTAEERLAAALS